MVNPISPQQLALDPSISYWLKTTLQEALQRDPIDAARDARLLSVILTAACDKALREAGQ